MILPGFLGCNTLSNAKTRSCLTATGEHFSEAFEKTDVETALAAGIFHREEVPIVAVKEHMRDEGIETR